MVGISNYLLNTAKSGLQTQSLTEAKTGQKYQNQMLLSSFFLAQIRAAS
jgi:hypothetical protein